MSILPSECQRGCLMKKWESASVLIPSSSYSNTDTVHADTVISSSFCPLTTNNYTLKFSGSYTNYFSYVFDVVTGSNPSTIKRKLYKNHCYYFSVYAADSKSASATFMVEVDSFTYIPNFRELISCKYNGVLHTIGRNNKCYKMNIYIYILSFLI